MVVVSATAVAFHNDNGLSKPDQQKEEEFYVGVTYCGNSVQEAMQLIDKVKNYSNLFVLQSGTLQSNSYSIMEIGDYAVSCGMYFLPCFGLTGSSNMLNFLETTEGRWGDKFLGVYYRDENGGKMLDSDTQVVNNTAKTWLGKTNGYPVISFEIDANCSASCYVFPEELIKLFCVENGTNVEYYKNGTVVAKVQNEFNITDSGIFIGTDDDSKIDYTIEISTEFTVIENYNATYTYEELWNMRPFQTYADVAESFVDTLRTNVYMNGLKDEDAPIFTSDYALYWFDYESGYDVLLAQLGWNHTLAQDIALVRGAATLQNKDWGTIITWKYNNPPYMDSGEAIYDQLCMSYEAGAKYAVIFNYAEDMSGPYGTLQEEHFYALERFWNQVVKSPSKENGSSKAEAALVLPENYGWGMRTPDDTLWGVFDADEKSAQIWQISRNLLEQYGIKLDIVYEDPEFPVDGYYSNVFYWNQTG